MSPFYLLVVSYQFSAYVLRTRYANSYQLSANGLDHRLEACATQATGMAHC
ncbi:MAG: hypothetical protein F6K50_21000 [Moorea sp. SIO3I7]|uniref:hypothetical protein n=1 Tax=Moorena sp. SIO3I8 TaxID=2607833 RepID=UPI0013C0B454|nr:hypothetical protein [Moorena sp. SIO3I8]NEN97902.1 hypothetical protein [Moorena sp. SIO3I7]NEO06557.1 hypothetical protein [Moorena sp. SIO3I8]